MKKGAKALCLMGLAMIICLALATGIQASASASLPKSMRGTWYTYNSKKLGWTKMKVTRRSMTLTDRSGATKYQLAKRHAVKQDTKTKFSILWRQNGVTRTSRDYFQRTTKRVAGKKRACLKQYFNQYGYQGLTSNWYRVKVAHK